VLADGAAHVNEGIGAERAPPERDLSVRAAGLAVLLGSTTLFFAAPPARAAGSDSNGVAALFYGSTVDPPGCSGTLIAPDVVLTSAACVGGITTVAVGVADWASPRRQLISVARQIAYPHAAATYDLGIVLLERPARALPRALARDCVASQWLVEGAAVTAVGWGTLRDSGVAPESTSLRQAATSVFDLECAGSDECNASIDPGGELAAGEDDPASCVGDDGGPLFLHGPDKVSYLVGVGSRSYDRPLDRCSGRRIYVRPDAVLAWIEETSGRLVARPDCNEAPVLAADSTALVVDAGGIATAMVQVSDPDPGDHHQFTLWTPPRHGEAFVDQNGFVVYAAPEAYVGADMFTVVVNDSGNPSLSGEIIFSAWILAAGAPPVVEQQGLVSGCSTGGGPATLGGALLLLAVLASCSRRRRRPSSRPGRW